MSDITIQNFEADLIQASLLQPVLLDIWAPWCGPCRALGPLLEKIELAYAGRFKLAKLNSDDQPEIAAQLSQAFGVRSIPFCVMFKDGQPVDGFVGALPEAQICEFLDRHVPSAEVLEAQDQTEQAEALEAEGDTDSALARLQQALATDPANDQARYDCVKLLIETGQVARPAPPGSPWRPRPWWMAASLRWACGWTPARRRRPRVRRKRWPRPSPPTGVTSRPGMSWPKPGWRPATLPRRWTRCSKS